ncbi:MAG TPA: LysR family transcriptional regulator [Pararhizobium sp.]|nr:LysR family transcriptional regulator [Pararhizobium sp.]
MDWNHIRSFVAIADAGTLSGAAKATGTSQPTLGRHIDELETSSGVTLFVRGRSGMSLTEAGLALIDDARAMAREADHLALTIAGRAASAAGPVRITASEIVATYFLPPILARLSDSEPEIEIELVASNAVQNLLSRDADIAVRMVRPAQNDVIARKVNDMAMGTFAASSYLERHGRPKTLDDLFKHRLIGFDRDDLMLRTLRAMGLEAERRMFAFRTDHQVAYWELLKAGAGVGFGGRHLASLTPGIVAVMPDLAIAPLPMWLASHQELRTSLKIRRVMDFLQEELSRLPLSA